MPPDGGGSADITDGRARHVVVPPVDGANRVSHEPKIREGFSRHGSRNGLAHRFGTTFADLFAHSWRRVPVSSWRWIPKFALVGEPGYIARSGEVRRLGLGARVVQRVSDPEPLSHSFTVVVREGKMDRGRGRPPRRSDDARP